VEPAALNLDGLKRVIEGHPRDLIDRPMSSAWEFQAVVSFKQSGFVQKGSVRTVQLVHQFFECQNFAREGPRILDSQALSNPK